jgi:tetratricopeptide (TPR) repeat protein
LKRFEKSKRQLLIALREVTESEKFDDIIEDEWSKIASEEARWLFYVAGVSTVARVGISKQDAEGIYRIRYDRSSRKLSEVLNDLEGIVLIGEDGRLRVRHEVYAEHIFGIEPLPAFLDAVKAILTALSRYEVPHTIRLTKNDSALFKWLLSAKSLYKKCNARGSPEKGLSIYQCFEKTFELDGHFWLQYGLYCRKLGEDEAALEYLKKSIQAYPGNAFAVHALADLKLRVATKASVSTSVAETYISEAVEDLLNLDARQDSRSDLYPIATLGTRHIAALLHLGREAEAQSTAQRYFDRVQQLMRSASSPKLERLRKSLLIYASTGIWSPASFAAMPWD